MKIVKEITDWQVDYRQPNHTYLLNAKKQIVAYAKWHSKTDVQVMQSRQILDSRYRKFVEVNHTRLSKIAKQFQEEDKVEKEEEIKPSAHVRVFHVKSKLKNKTYTVSFNTINKQVSCGCTGYGYRRTCSHVKAVANKLGV